MITVPSILMLLALGWAAPPAFADLQDGDDADLLGLFPDSGAPTYYGEKSSLVLERTYKPESRNSEWHPELDEKNVFHARLQHRSREERSWELGIGRGGQLYSLCSSFGESMAPQTPLAPWVDEVWQMTTLSSRGFEKRFSDELRHRTNPFVHQSGIYIRDSGTPAFYSPLLARAHFPEIRAYGVLSWGQVPDAGIKRSGTLIYAQYRDLGAGVIEITYVVYNFEPVPLKNLSPWGGVRTSVFPEHVVSNPDGGYRFFTPWAYGGGQGKVRMEETGGWAAAVRNASNPKDFAIAVVFGKKAGREGGYYDCGNSRHGKRDYTAQATVFKVRDATCTPYLVRMYLVIGTLEEAAARANELSAHAGFSPMAFPESDAPLIPLYARRCPGGERVLSRRPPEGEEPVPLCGVHARPVKGSLPLFVIRENSSGKHFMTTDPYARCDREPFQNPFAPEDFRHRKYADRTVYRPFMRKTEWVELLGFVMPRARTEKASLSYVPFSSLGEMSESFFPGERSEAGEIMVLK